VPHELLGLLDYEMNGSKELPNTLKSRTRTVSVFLSRLREDLGSGDGIVQESPAARDEITLPVVPDLNEPATSTLDTWDPLDHGRETQKHGAERTDPPLGSNTDRWFKVRAAKGRMR
jgi:hypothetical protein